MHLSLILIAFRSILSFMVIMGSIVLSCNLFAGSFLICGIDCTIILLYCLHCEANYLYHCHFIVILS
jgi:hypothetical protein